LNAEGAIVETSWRKTGEPGALNYLSSRGFEFLPQSPWERFVAIVQYLVRDIRCVIEIRENSIDGVKIPVERIETESRSRKQVPSRKVLSGGRVF
jgi:hypothetical protein